jgi:hypothetical protein
MSKRRTYSVRIGRPGHRREDMTDPPFFHIEADSASLDDEGTLSIKSGAGRRVFRTHMWQLCEIRRNTGPEDTP